MRTLNQIALACLLTTFLAAVGQTQTVLFRDQMTNSGTWGQNTGGDADVNVTFAYDYSSNGIPEAPNSEGGDTATSGVKMEANQGGAAAAAYFTLYPLGQNFSGDYTLRFDAWMNYDAVEASGAAVGTTEFLGGGIGYDNVTADIASGAQFMVTGEGGSANDWRAFKSPPQFFIPAADMTGGSRNGTDPYYADFFLGLAPPAAQNQGFTFGQPGSPGFEWVTWETQFDGSEVSITVERNASERLEIVRYDPTDTSDGSSGVNTDGNISLFYADFFTSITSRPDLTFGLVDNVVVTSIDSGLTGDFDNDGNVDGNDFLEWQRGNPSMPPNSSDLQDWQNNFGTPLVGAVTAVPEPGCVAILGMACLGLALSRRIRF